MKCTAAGGGGGCDGDGGDLSAEWTPEAEGGTEGGMGDCKRPLQVTGCWINEQFANLKGHLPSAPSPTI